jgi:hypothetical protein
MVLIDNSLVINYAHRSYLRSMINRLGLVCTPNINYKACINKMSYSDKSYTIKSIRTTGSRNIIFRSKTEAVWAHLFDRLAWSWQYEPFRLTKYIPDFILSFPHGDLLVEVKGQYSCEELLHAHYEYSAKVRQSGWQGNYAILGHNIVWNNDQIQIGWLFHTSMLEPISKMIINKVKQVWTFNGYDEDKDSTILAIYHFGMSRALADGRNTETNICILEGCSNHKDVAKHFCKFHDLKINL